MDEAAPQAATGKTTDRQALEVLRQEWGQWYWIGHDALRGWWAQRRDELGGDITAETPDELLTAINQDHTLKPVSRELAGHVETGFTRL
jgi:hypothetical protein